MQNSMNFLQFFLSQGDNGFVLAPSRIPTSEAFSKQNKYSFQLKELLKLQLHKIYKYSF